MQKTQSRSLWDAFPRFGHRKDSSILRMLLGKPNSDLKTLDWSDETALMSAAMSGSKGLSPFFSGKRLSTCIAEMKWANTFDTDCYGGTFPSD